MGYNGTYASTGVLKSPLCILNLTGTHVFHNTHVCCAGVEIANESYCDIQCKQHE